MHLGISESDWVRQYFGSEFKINDGSSTYRTTSTYRALRNHADRETGRIDGDKAKRHSWLGAASYLILLDQLGTCFIPGTFGSKKRVVELLETRGGLKTADAKALYSLRCSLAHDFGLQNVSNSDQDLTRHFALCADQVKQIVTHPTTAWNGSSSSIIGSQTLIDIALLGDKVVEICDNLEVDANTNTLQLEMSLDEFVTRFFWMY